MDNKLPSVEQEKLLERRGQHRTISAICIASIGVLLPVIFWHSNLPKAALVIWGLAQFPICLTLIVSLRRQLEGLEKKARQWNMITLVTWSIGFASLPWFNPHAIGIPLEQAMLICAMLAVTGALAASANLYPRQHRLRSTMLVVIAFSYTGACLLNAQWAPATVVLLWAIFLLTTTEVNVHSAMELRRLRSESEYGATHDSLTGLLNRHGFINCIETVLQSPRKQSLAIIDLDDFKLINDTLGHRFGDQVLSKTGERLRQSLPQGSIIARIGGDEYAAILPFHPHTQLCEILEITLAAISRPVEYKHRKKDIRASIGIALHYTGISASDWLAEADIAMYRSKRDLKSSLWLYDNATRQETIQRVELEERFRKAMDDDEIIFWCQPIVRTSDTQPLAVELLARWPQADGSFISPAEFIPIAQQTSLIIDLGRKALQCAADLLNKWSVHPQFSTLTVNVNISPMHLGAGLFEDIRAVYPAMDSRLGIEFVETELISTTGKARDCLEKLASSALLLIIDDFGVGYSSLSYLWSLPLDKLKIDRSFIEGIENDPLRQQLIASIIDMTSALDITCVAEGIETEEARDILHKRGVHELQGFGISRPQRPEAIEETLSSLFRHSIETTAISRSGNETPRLKQIAPA